MTVLPRSNAQIQAILNTNKAPLYYRLSMIFCKFIQKKNSQDLLYALFREKKTDIEYFEKIAMQMYKPQELGVNTFVVYTILGLLSSLKIKPKTILDFGCGDCGIIEAIGKELKLPKDAVYGTDIKDTFEQSWNASRVSKNITFEFTSFDKVVPFNQKFDVIMALMVFHHIEEPKPIIKDLYDALSSGGILIIREHDCTNKNDSIFADLVHSLYIVKNNGVDKEKILSQHNFYRSAQEWRGIFESVGFTEINMDHDAMSMTNNYRAVYRRS